ncbi:MAG: NnrS family protein [Chloroflexi bacterium]|nr:NnrS family protein [Chloroflexota bacterium]
MALPTTDQRRSLLVTVLFLASSFAFAITAGFGLGTWLLLHATIGVPLPEATWSALVQVHGHAQLVGFAGLLVMGIAHRIFPRFRGADEPTTREVVLAYGLVAGGLLLRPAQIWTDLPARDALLMASGAAELAGMLVYARLAIRTLAGGTNAHRADELFIGAGAVFGVIGAMWGLVALAPTLTGGATLDPDPDRAHIAALLLGFVSAHVIGVSLRVAPAFIAAPPASDRVIVGAVIAWAAGVTLATLGEPLGPVVLLGTALVLVRVIGPFGRSVAVRDVPAPARVVRLAFRGAYAWLVAGIALLAAGAIPGMPLGSEVAGRHAIALGFLTQIVFGVGSRLIPAVTGGRAPSVAAVRAAIVLANVAAALRVVFELVGPNVTGAAIALAASGPVALAALSVFGMAAAHSVRSALRSAIA